MSPRAASLPPRTNWSEKGTHAINAGNLGVAKQCFEKAVKLETNNARHRFNLAIVLQAFKDFRAAAEQFTVALRLDPDMADAARRLGSMVQRRLIPASVRLDALGLKAALRHQFINREQIAEAAIYYLARQDLLKAAFDHGGKDGWLAAARSLALDKTGALLKDDLFCACLQDNIIRLPDLERLLTALRRVLLLEVAPERFADRALMNFTITLLHQCWVNEYVWAVSADEAEHLSAMKIPVGALTEGDAEAGRQLALSALYRPISACIDREPPVADFSRVRPRALRETIERHMSEQREERTRAVKIRRLGAITDETSLKVAEQYRDYPYPRWTSLGVLVRPGEWRRSMSRFFPPQKLAFMDGPFDVLVAGCGTGLQAIAAASCYGPAARVSAIDISISSLAYAESAASRFSIPNVEFLQADILEAGGFPDFRSRFHVIECVGVLHHMADPFRGWRALLKCLAPGGVMIVGLYSALARKQWAAMRADPECPGPGCDDNELRAFRELLLSRGDDELGRDFRGIRDIYTTSGFRDFMLHVREHNHRLNEIGDFLSENGLVFRGFDTGASFERMREHFPDDVWPGKLEHWAEFEQMNPQLFGNMYRFWCDRP